MTTPMARVTRRSCLQGSAFLALQALTVSRLWARAPLRDVVRIDALIVEGVLSEAVALVRDAQPHAHVEPLGDDPAKLFYGRLVPGWRLHGVRGLMGLTRAPALFLLEQLVSDYGLRTVALQRMPSAAATYATLQQSVRQRQSTAPPELLRDALLEGDDAAFVWLMAPVRLPMCRGVSVVAT
jgi:hypothetical protein